MAINIKLSTKSAVSYIKGLPHLLPLNGLLAFCAVFSEAPGTSEMDSTANLGSRRGTLSESECLLIITPNLYIYIRGDKQRTTRRVINSGRKRRYLSDREL